MPIPRFFSPSWEKDVSIVRVDRVYIYILRFNARYMCEQICIFRKIVGEDVAVHRFQIARMITENALVTVL